MTTLAGILAAAALAHLGGHVLGGVLGRLGLLGFGKKLRIARHVLRLGKALRKAYQRDKSSKVREDLRRWLEEHDPKNETGLGSGVV